MSIAAMRDSHFVGYIRGRLNENRHPEIGPAQCVGDGSFLTEVGQGYDDAVNAATVTAKEFGAAVRFVASFDRSVFALLRT